MRSSCGTTFSLTSSNDKKDVPIQSPPFSSSPRRILCIHGHNSNNDITQLQIMALKLTSTKYNTTCDFLHGPHMGAPSRGLKLFSNGPWYRWGSSEEEFDKSLEYVADYVKKNGPYAGVYAFSQGVAIVTIFSNPSIWRERFGMVDLPWKFAILACGGGSALLSSSNNGKLNVPSFHIKAVRDIHLPDSTILESYWNKDKRKSYTHGGGHEIALRIFDSEPDLAGLFYSFLDEQMNNIM